MGEGYFNSRTVVPSIGENQEVSFKKFVMKCQLRKSKNKSKKKGKKK